MTQTYGRLQRGNADSIEFGLYGFRGGLNVKSAPQSVGDHDLTVATNGYLRADGGFQLRNGMLASGDSLGSSGSVVLARFYQAVRNGASVTPLVELLAQYNGDLYRSQTNSGQAANSLIGSIGGSNAQPMTWVRVQDPNSPSATGLTDVMVICTGYGGPYVYDGFQIYTPAGWSAASGARWCAIVNGIIWFGGIPNFPNQVFGTGDGIINSMESLPAIRNFVFSAPVAGLCAQGSGATASLVVGRNTGLSVLYGSGPSTFFLQDLPFPDGVVAGRSMVSANGIVYFLGHEAFYAFDGQTVPRRISDKIEPWILNDPLVPGYPITGNADEAWACVYNNRIHLGYASGSSSLNTILIYDLVAQGWTVLRTTPGLASMVLLDAPTDPNPYVAYAGSSTDGQVYQWDYVPPFASAANVVLDGSTPVLAQVQSKFFKIGVPGTNKVLKRFYPELLVAGYFACPMTVSTDYGNITQSTVVSQGLSGTNVLVWDVGQWDVNLWGAFGFNSFNAPASRVDYDNIQAESFAFGFSMTQALAPWIWSGGTGVFLQRGRT